MVLQVMFISFRLDKILLCLLEMIGALGSPKYKVHTTFQKEIAKHTTNYDSIFSTANMVPSLAFVLPEV